MPQPETLTDLSLEALKGRVAKWGLKPFASTQIVEWLYQKRSESFASMSNLSKPARLVLEKEARLSSLKTADIRRSQDGTCLFLFELSDGKKVEAVYIPAESGRKTLCISSQAGCAMGCGFCRTGRMGLLRNLSQGEILEQVLHILRCFPEEKITNIVFMGMGEPMANLSALLPALEILQHPKALGFSKRRITVSTVGPVPKMYEYMKQASAKLAISLHAPNNGLRDRLVPINRRYPLEQLMQFCRDYKRQSKYRITFEYVMLKGINDTPKELKELSTLLEGIPSKVNLIPFNPFPTADFEPSDPATLQHWTESLIRSGIQTNIRANRGRDILAACGQLAA